MPMEPTKAVTEEDEEEECEDDIEGSLITMETTLGLVSNAILQPF